MKRVLSAFAALLLIAALLPTSAAGKTAEYKDEIYSFRYPAAWKRGTAKDGTVTLRIPGGSDGVMTFAITADILQLTGDAGQDGPLIKQYIGGVKLSAVQLDGTYEALEQNSLRGFRAFGKAGGKLRAELVLLTGKGSMVVFIFIGEKAIAEEGTILSSLSVTDRMKDEETGNADYKRWKGGGFSLLYPKDYGTMEQKTGMVFIEMKGKKDTIMARTYSLNTAYSKEQAPSIAKAKLPKSTGVQAEPQMTRVGDWDAAVITGNTKAGPMAFYIIGSGRTALALMFIGKEAIGHAETVVASVVFK